MAKMITDLTVMAAAYHQRIAPLADFSPMARLLKGRRADGSVVVLLPADHVIWTSRVEAVADEIMQTEKNKKNGSFEIWVMGSLSGLARSSLASSGWRIHEQAYGMLFPETALPWPVKQVP